MRTTVDIQDEVLRRARELAARTDQTLGDVVTDALRLLLEDKREGPLRPLPVARGGALAPGADLAPATLKEVLRDEEEERWRGSH